MNSHQPWAQGRGSARRALGTAAFCALALTAAFSAAAQDEKLPKGVDVLERSIEAMGGDALDKIHNRVAKGTIEIKGMGMKGTVELYSTKEGNNYTAIDLEGLGKIIRGSDGEIVWEINPMTGPRIVEGEERDLMLLLGRFDDSDYEEHFESIECTGAEAVEGELCYKVELTPKGLRPITTYFSKNTGLAVKSSLTVNTQMGDMKTESLVMDYKEVDGVLFPHRTLETTMGTTMEVVLSEVKHNVELAADRFDPPEEIQALLKGKKD